MQRIHLWLLGLGLAMLLSACSTCNVCTAPRVETSVLMCLSDRPDATIEASSCETVDLSVLVTD